MKNKQKLVFSGSPSSISPPTPTFPQLVLLKSLQMDLDEICSSAIAQTTLSESSAYQHENDKQDAGDFYTCLRPILILGRLLGILPISGIFINKTLTKINFGWNSIPVLCSFLVLLILGANTTLSFFNLFRLFEEGPIGGNTASLMAIAAHTPMFYFMSFLIYLFFLLRSKTLIKLFFKWRVVTGDLGFKNKDTNLSKHFLLLAGSIFGFGIFENVLYTVNNFPISTRGPNQTLFEEHFTPLETYFWRSHPHWASLLAYNPVITVILLVSNLLASYAWSYADLFIVVCSRALYYKFKILVDQTTEKLLGMKKESKQHSTLLTSVSKNEGIFHWSQVRKDHLTLCKLLDELELFLSPLIFLSYSANIFFICLEIHQGLTPQDSNSHLTSAFSLCTFIHLLLRVLAVSITAAKVNEYVHQISVTIQRCDTADYCSELERLERMLAAGPIGLSGLGCFVVSRAFLLMVVSVVFTVEIVLLQASATPGEQLQIESGLNATTTELPSLEF